MVNFVKKSEIARSFYLGTGIHKKEGRLESDVRELGGLMEILLKIWSVHKCRFLQIKHM